MCTVHSLPVKPEIREAISDSNFAADISLTELAMVNPKNKIGDLLYRFSIVFQMPTNAEHSEVIDVWNNVLSDYTEEQIFKAGSKLIRTLKRFPYPSDFIEEIEADKSSEAA